MAALRWALALLFRRFRWIALGAALRSLTRRTRERSVTDATEELAQRLPSAVVKAADAAPGDLLRIGGSAMAAGRTARTVGDRSRRLGSATRTLRRRWSNPGDSVRELREQWRRESELARRELWAEYHRAQGDHGTADEVLLDRRGVDRSQDEPLPSVPQPVRPGRPPVRRAARTVVNRAQRTYRRTPKPWDR